MKPKSIVILALLLVAACAPALHQVRHVQQRQSNECAVAVLAMMTGAIYERAKSVLTVHPDGVYVKDFIAGAEQLGVKVERIPAERVSLFNDEGALLIQWCDERPAGPPAIHVDENEVTIEPSPSYHLVYLKDGIIYDPLREFPTFSLTWLQKECAKVIVLLRKVKETK